MENERRGIFKYLKGDKGIWYIVFILSFLSILVVYSSTGLLAYRLHEGDTSFYLGKHTFVLIAGWIILYIAHRLPYTFYSRIGQILFWISIPLLVLTLSSQEVNDASRWLTVPGLGITFQTSDLAKMALIMYLARLLAKKQSTIKERTTFYIVLAAPLVICGFIFSENLSTAVLVMLTSMVMMMFGGIRTRYMLGLVGGFVLLAALMLSSFYIVPEDKLPGRFATWKSRVEAFTTDQEDPTSNYQALQAKIAVAGGATRIIGKMPGNSTQRNFLPHPDSDYVYAIIVEEYGLVGALGVLLLFLWFLRRGINIARKCQGSFGCFLVLGLCFMLTLQALVNMGVSVDLLPVTGQILPFLSMGGTAFWFTSLSVGIVLSVSVAVEKQEAGKGVDLATQEKSAAVNG